MQHEHHRVPVTALAFWNEHVILAGEGHWLKAYDVRSGSLLAAEAVFESQPIHGLVVTEHVGSAHVFIYGGSLACRATIHLQLDGSLTIDHGRMQCANDWILDAASREEDGSQIAVVTAHNALSIATFGAPTGTSFTPLVAGSNCILYSANITWLSPSKCLIASGTAFGDVIVWSCTITQQDDTFSAICHTHYTFSAHQGSVFGLQVSSPEVASQVGGRQSLLVTCSDDRTIRLWDVSDLSIKSLTLAEEQRETGFGSDLSSETHAPPLLAKVLGVHQSRIWHVRFLPPVRNGPEMLCNQACSIGHVSMVSFGEDATSITWMLEKCDSSSESLPYGFRQLDCLNAHSGKNIWSFALGRTSDIASGAADGAIVLRAFSVSGASPQHDDMLSETITSDTDTAGAYRAYAFLDSGKLLASTDSGRLLLLSIHPYSTTHEVSQRINVLEGYSVMDSIPGLAVVAGKKGAVYAYSLQSDKLCRIMDAGRKVAGVFVRDGNADYGHDNPRAIDLLVTTMGSTSAALCKIENANCSTDFSITSTSSLILPSGWVVTSFVYFQQSGVDFAILGSRGGSLAIFQLPERCHEPISSSLLLDGVHGKESVTCLHILAEDDRIVLLSTGRDGTYAAHEISWTSNKVQVTLAHQISLPFGPNVEGIGKSENGHLRVWGFRSKEFVVYDIDEQQEIMTVECGGAHRNWVYQPAINGGSFVWTKASKMKFKSQSEATFVSLNSGGHGREIKATAVSPTDQNLIATGAEDTNIKLSRLEKGRFRCQHTLRKHNTGIQYLQWSLDGQYLFSSGGFEEFYVWKISSDVPGLRLGVFCESQHPNSGASELRIMSFDVQGYQSDSGPDGFQIWMVYSDSTIRQWQYGQREWNLLSTGNYLTSCLTQCIQLGEKTLLTASTDGHVATWITSKWTTRHKVHQSTILSMATTQLDDKSHLLLTGGDDNAIGISRLTASGDNFRSLVLPGAHAAAVTGLDIVHRVDGTTLWFVSASIDQRVKLWRLDTVLDEAGINGFDVKLVRNGFTAVADVSGLERMTLTDDGVGVLICGVGMDVWRLDVEALEGSVVK